MELVLVLAIIGILSAIALPRYSSGLATYRVRSAAARLAADLTDAREQARATSSTVRVTFDANGHAYLVAREKDNVVTLALAKVDLGEEPFVCAIAKVDFAGRSELVFDGRGVPIDGGEVKVRAGERTLTVTVDDVTGLVRYGP